MTAAERLRRPALALTAIVLVAAGARCLALGSSAPVAGVPGPTTPIAGSAGTGADIVAPAGVTVVAPAAPTGAVVSPPASIASNCSVDVAPALQAWIDSVPDNSTLRLGANACYRSDESIRLVNRHRILIDGNGATLKAMTQGGRGRSQLALSGGADLTVRNLITRGANPRAGANAAAYNPSLEAQHGFVIGGATNVLLDHVQAFDTYGDFVYIGPGLRQDGLSRAVTVANSRFDRSGRQGISITAGVDIDIEANTIADVARSIFDIEANVVNTQIRNVRISGNVTGAAVNFWLADKGYPADIGNVQIVGNRMAATTGGLIFVYTINHAYRGPFVVARNQFIANDAINDEGSTGAFVFAHATEVTISDNDVTFPSGKDMPAVELRDAHHVEITGNHFAGAGRTVIASDGSTDIHSA